jgi:nicotinamide phosphoribosyltransferase
MPEMYTGNPILGSDSYKVTHWLQYPPGTQKVYSYLESRGGVYPYTLFFSLQYLLKRYLVGERVSAANVIQANKILGQHFGDQRVFNFAGWMELVNKHQGRFPVRIKAVPEGTKVPNGNVLMTMENTDPAFPWITNYLESLLLKVWYGTTVATQSNAIRRDILEQLKRTGTPAEIDFKLHDFGYRGVSSEESARVGGAVHLLNFNGTDTLRAFELIHDYYGFDEKVAGFSVPAAEHSTITSWGKEREAEAYLNMLNRFPTGIVAVVSDSYDIMKAVNEIWGDSIREQVLNRQGITVIRPDSGDPPSTVLAVVRSLAERFGAEENDKGFLVLNPKVRVIQGDGVNRQSIGAILATLAGAGFSADNVAFGMGGALLQQVNRDTLQFAFKCSATQIEDKWYPVKKEAAGKPSKPGKLALIKDQVVGFRTVNTGFLEGTQLYGDQLRTVFEDGRLVVEENFDAIRARAREGVS